MDLKHAEFYGLCALYCDYYEWLTSPTYISADTRRRYETKLYEIVQEIARKHESGR